MPEQAPSEPQAVGGGGQVQNVLHHQHWEALREGGEDQRRLHLQLETAALKVLRPQSTGLMIENP